MCVWVVLLLHPIVAKFHDGTAIMPNSWHSVAWVRMLHLYSSKHTSCHCVPTILQGFLYLCCQRQILFRPEGFGFRAWRCSSRHCQNVFIFPNNSYLNCWMCSCSGLAPEFIPVLCKSNKPFNFCHCTVRCSIQWMLSNELFSCRAQGS